ncbi:hypothetical protein [Reichenbachiella sp. MALMAid0571]|uniref:hypothetical protein n=1 Tax=Reichenbachiella sp. MALMAid0571 TaxID=3143939 RepID=UPI0032DF533A
MDHQNRNWFQGLVCLGVTASMITLFTCKEESLTNVDFSYTKEIPESIHPIMAQLEKKYPEVNFTYKEIDAEPNGTFEITWSVESETIMHTELFEDVHKLGVISAPTKEFR